MTGPNADRCLVPNKECMASVVIEVAGRMLEASREQHGCTHDGEAKTIAAVQSNLLRKELPIG